MGGSGKLEHLSLGVELELVRSLGYLPACRVPPDANSTAGAEGEIVGPLAKSPKIANGAE